MATYKNQGYLVITAETGINITSATIMRINYKNPEGTTGYFTAQLSGTTALTYQCTNSDLGVAGGWQFQAYVRIGGLDAYGDIFYENIYNPL